MSTGTLNRPARRRRRAAPVQEALQEKSQDPAEKADSTEVDVILERDNEIAIMARYRARIRNRSTAIRAFCVECMGGKIAEVRRCTSSGCPLYAFRMGGDPFHSRSKGNAVEDGDQDS